MTTDNGDVWAEVVRLLEQLRTMRLEPMTPERIRQLMDAPAVKPPANEERIALKAWRLATAHERGRAAGLALGSLLMPRKDDAA
jgi:hypothetical protein